MIHGGWELGLETDKPVFRPQNHHFLAVGNPGTLVSSSTEWRREYCLSLSVAVKVKCMWSGGQGGPPFSIHVIITTFTMTEAWALSLLPSGYTIGAWRTTRKLITVVGEKLPPFLEWETFCWLTSQKWAGAYEPLETDSLTPLLKPKEDNVYPVDEVVSFQWPGDFRQGESCHPVAEGSRPRPTSSSYHQQRSLRFWPASEFMRP